MNLEIQLDRVAQGLRQEALDTVDAEKIRETFRLSVLAVSVEDRHYMTLDAIGALLGIDATASGVMRCVGLLIDANLLEVRAQYVDQSDNVWEFDSAGYKAALAAGAFIDPNTGRAIADTDLLAPHWAIPEDIAA